MHNSRVIIVYPYMKDSNAVCILYTGAVEKSPNSVEAASLWGIMFFLVDLHRDTHAIYYIVFISWYVISLACVWSMISSSSNNKSLEEDIQIFSKIPCEWVSTRGPWNKTPKKADNSTVNYATRNAKKLTSILWNRVDLAAICKVAYNKKSETPNKFYETSKNVVVT